MIKSVLHLFKIHREVIFGNSSVIVQNMLGIAPKSLDPVDMVLAAVSKGLAVIQAMVLAPALQGIVASEGVRVIHRSLSGALSDMGHQFISRHLLHDLGVDPSIPLQKAQNNAFPRGSPATLAFPSTTEISLVYLNLALESACFQLCYMIDRLAQTLVDAGHHLIIQTQVRSYAIGRLLLVETPKNTDLFAQTLQRFLFSTTLAPAFDIAAAGLVNFERTAEYALSPPQKVGRTVENVLLTSNHKGILTPRGYEIH